MEGMNERSGCACDVLVAGPPYYVRQLSTLLYPLADAMMNVLNFRQSIAQVRLDFTSIDQSVCRVYIPTSMATFPYLVLILRSHNVDRKRNTGGISRQLTVHILGKIAI